MVMALEQKDKIKRLLIELLAGQNEVRKIVIFGSFLKAPEPHDIDVAVFQDSTENYLTLAMKYRRMTRDISQIIPLDIIPIKAGAEEAVFLSEINEGEVIYER
jgi:predicted nucleotidyltransferase